MKPARAAFALVLELALPGCNDRAASLATHGTDSGIADDGGSPFAGARFLALQADPLLDPPRVLDLERRTLDGIDVELELNGDTLRVRARDAAGNELAMSVDGGREPWAGELQSCAARECVTQALNARRLASEDSEARGFSLLGEVRGNWERTKVFSVAVQGATAVVSLEQLGFAVIDVSRPTTPRITYEWRPPDYGERVTDVELLDARWLVVTSTSRGLRVFELVAGAPPVPVVDSFIGVGGESHTLFVDGDRLYLARIGSRGGLDIVDIANPAFPRAVAALALDDCRQVHEAFVRDATLFASCLDDGLVAYDLADETTPRALAHWPGRSVHSAWLLDDTTVLVSSERLEGPLEVLHFDRQERTFEPLAALALGTGASAHEARCQASRCSLTYYQEGVLELDLSDPRAPEVLRQFPTWSRRGNDFFEGASSVVLAGDLAYVADTERGLLILETDLVSSSRR